MDLCLTSKRLSLTPFSADEEALALELFTDPAVTQFVDGPVSKDDVLSDMLNWVKRGADGCIGIWCISDRRSSEKLGSIALLPIPIEEDDTDFSLVVPGRMPDGDIEIGFFLKPSAWGQGIASEACARILKFAFEASPLHEVVATFDDGNHASRKVLTKAGFVDHGRRRCYGEIGPDYRIKRSGWLKHLAAGNRE